MDNQLETIYIRVGFVAEKTATVFAGFMVILQSERHSNAFRRWLWRYIMACGFLHARAEEHRIVWKLVCFDQWVRRHVVYIKSEQQRRKAGTLSDACQNLMRRQNRIIKVDTEDSLWQKFIRYIKCMEKLATINLDSKPWCHTLVKYFIEVEEDS